MHSTWSKYTLLAMVVLHSAPLAAQGLNSRFEITPFAAYRIGGTFHEQDGEGRVSVNDSSAQGLIFNIKANPNGQYELLYSQQSTDADTHGFVDGDPSIDMDIEQFEFGGTYLFDGDNTRPFIALTVGMSRFDPELPGAQSENFFSASFGGGVHLNANKRLGVRLEARAFATFVDDNSSIFCSSIDGAGGCLIKLDGRILTQWEARAGVVFRF